MERVRFPVTIAWFTNSIRIESWQRIKISIGFNIAHVRHFNLFVMDVGANWKLKPKIFDLLQYESNRMDRRLFCDFNGKLKSMKRKIWSRGQFHIYFLVLLIEIYLFYFFSSSSSSTDESSIFNIDTVPKCELKTEIYACVIEQQQ